MDKPDVIAIYGELESLRNLVNSHGNHLSTLQDQTDLALTYLKVFAAALGINMAMIGSVIVLALR